MTDSWIVEKIGWNAVYGPFKTPREASKFAGRTGGEIVEIENDQVRETVVVKLITHIGDKPICNPRNFRG